MKTHAFILSILLITSCRSHKESTMSSSVTSSAGAAESVVTKRDIWSGLRLRDSCALSVDSPLVEIFRPDSTVVRLTAQRLTVASRATLTFEQSDTLSTSHIAQNHVAASSRTDTYTDLRVEAASMSRWVWAVGVAAVVLLWWLMRKYIRR